MPKNKKDTQNEEETQEGQEPEGTTEEEETTQETETQEPPRTFSQADVDRIIKDRLAREKSKYADYDDLKDQAGKWQKHLDDQKSELERAQERAEQAEQAREEALQRAEESMIRAAFLAEAGKLQAAHPEDAYRLADLASVRIAEDGSVEGVEDAVKVLVDSGRLPLVGRQKAPDLDGGAGGGSRSSTTSAKLTPEELEVAVKMGLTPEQYAKYKKKK
jgi:hypothetical protein